MDRFVRPAAPQLVRLLTTALTAVQLWCPGLIFLTFRLRSQTRAALQRQWCRTHPHLLPINKPAGELPWLRRFLSGASWHQCWYWPY